MEEIAAVYAQALLEVALEYNSLDEMHDQLDQFADAVEGNHELQVFFFSPYFSTPEKQNGLERMLSGADAHFQNFLNLLIEKHRMPFVFRIRAGFDELWEKEHHQLAVSVTSAVNLDERTVEQIGARISERTGQRVDLTSIVDPAIIGGVILRVGNSILDASIRNRLELLRKQVARG
jgi:F-type H+-transporting ATPase subunit delta